MAIMRAAKLGKVKLIIAIVSLVFISANIYGQKTYLKAEEVPQEITAYVASHLPDNNVVYGKKEVKANKTKYEIRLRDGAELEFNEKMELKEVKSKSGLPLAVVPKKIWDYTAAKYPGISIVEWEKKKGYQKIELHNGFDLYFDESGNFTRLKK